MHWKSSDTDIGVALQRSSEGHELLPLARLVCEPCEHDGLVILELGC